jgi:tetratricopeptide (TPR) repeat protein
MNSPDPSEEKAGARLSRGWARLRGFGVRDAWWHVLDLLEARRALRLAVYATGLLAVLALATAVWIYPWWQRQTAVSMARQWLAAGKLEQASTSIQQALKIAPGNPESWKLAADLSRRLGNKKSALGYSEKAATLAPERADLTLIWASDALLADQSDEAGRALALLSADTLAGSAPAQRILGELARRRADLSAARAHFENALGLEGSGTAINEIPLGVVLLQAKDRALRQRGLDLLAKWQADPEWGANAARTLLQDALARDDHPAMRKWADVLRAHPRCTLGDIPNCLLALSKADEPRFFEVIAGMEKNHAGDSPNIALLVSWLNQIGRSDEALRWTDSLPANLTGRPPAAVGIAEALRLTARWSALLDRVQAAPWGADLKPVQLNYEFLSARKTGRTELAGELWATIKARAAIDGPRTLFTADTLYAWGLRDEAVTLLWAGADLSDIAFNALGTLARHYQVQRDANGQYEVFKRLRTLRPNDESIANNFAFFAALTGNDSRLAEDAAKRNFERQPDSLAFRSTYAFVLCIQHRAAEALALLAPAASGWRDHPVMMLAYGLALAGTGQQDQARVVLGGIDPATLTAAEARMIADAVK